MFRTSPSNQQPWYLVCWTVPIRSLHIYSVSTPVVILSFRAYGLSLSACDLLSSYTSNRRQRVQIKGSRSEWREVKKEYPRAQFLAPCFLKYSLMICFLLLTNVHCTTTKTTNPYLLLPVCSWCCFKFRDRLQQYHGTVFFRWFTNKPIEVSIYVAII